MKLSLDAQPLRQMLLEWRYMTGDSWELIARGFDLSVALVESVVCVSTESVDVATAASVTTSLRVDPAAVWEGEFTAAHQVAADWSPAAFCGDARYEPWPTSTARSTAVWVRGGVVPIDRQTVRWLSSDVAWIVGGTLVTVTLGIALCLVRATGRRLGAESTGTDVDESARSSFRSAEEAKIYDPIQLAEIRTAARAVRAEQKKRRNG